VGRRAADSNSFSLRHNWTVRHVTAPTLGQG